MIRFLGKDESLTVDEIEKFIDKHDYLGVFDTRKKWQENFIKHFDKLIHVKQIATFRDDEKLAGLCSWALVDLARKHDINKARWTLPEEVTYGNILYVDICLLTSGTNVFQIKKFLGEKYRTMAKEGFWFNVSTGQVFSFKIKGGTTCPKELIAAF